MATPMHDIGWGTVNQAVLDHADQLLRDSRTKPALLIRETHHLSTLSTAAMNHQSPDPAEVAHLLNQAGIDFCLIGAHALAVHAKEARATKDVDVVVGDVPAAVTALLPIRARTRVVDLGEGIGKRIVNAKGIELIDILESTSGLRGVIFSNRIRVTLSGHKASVPTLPAMIALKWLAMFSPSRDPVKQFQDKADFVRIVKVHPDLNIPAAAKLVALTSTMLARQLIHDMKEYKKTGNIRLFSEPSPGV